MTKRDDKLLERYNAIKGKSRGKIESIFEGRFEDLVEKSINLKLRCESCDDESYYDLHHLFINPKAKGIPYKGKR